MKNRKLKKLAVALNLLVILLFFGLNSIFSNESIEQKSLIDSFEKANLLYNNAQYVESLENYKEIIDSGYQSAAIFYNMGNCYYKINDIANAILFYERSILINPADEDVRNNLQMVRNSLIDDIDHSKPQPSTLPPTGNKGKGEGQSSSACVCGSCSNSPLLSPISI